MAERPAPEWPQDCLRVVLDAVDSTNAEALRRLPDLAAPCWIMARSQTSGRGRRGRGWVDPPGNFAATLALPLSERPARMALRSFLAALALHDALTAATGLAQGLTLKWPNDLLLNGGKLSGILLESGAGGLVIGIGVNLRTAPPAEAGAAFPAVSLRGETGLALAADTLLDHLAVAWAQWEARFRAYGFAPVRQAFLDRVERLGSVIVARTLTETLEGRFTGIDDTGALVLDTAEGRRIIPAADVYFP
ncbi:MAG TPA: biotin--[acetyl-CoA-carboxylase] ligase [Paracoccus sp.]|nr:biotin--[acetyl-CoA-carboxylase] ligase [Paracoccus sp. (in: a-proteobacteria)]